MSNQSLRQASVRAVTSTTGTLEEDWIALFDNDGIAAGTFNERFYLWLAGKTSLTGRTLDELMNAFAVSQGVSDWSSLGTFDASSGDVSAIIPIVFFYRMQKESPMQYLKQATASQSVLIGPFVDATDGVTAETGLTIANTDIRLSANGGNMVAKNSGGGTHDELGMYSITLDATDTATVGKLQLICAKSGALPVYHTFYVLEENVYDAWFAASAAAGTNLAAILTDTGTDIPASLTAIDNFIDTEVAAIKAVTDNLPDSGALTSLAQATDLATVDTVVDAIKVVADRQANIMGTGTCTTGGSTTSVIASAITPTSVEDDQFNGRIIVFRNDTTTTALRGQATDITDYTHSTKTFTVTALSEAPASGDVFDIV